MLQVCFSTFDFKKQTLELREMLVSRAYVLFLVLMLPERVVSMAVFAMSCTLKLLTEKSMKFIFAWTTELLGFGLDLLLIWKKV